MSQPRDNNGGETWERTGFYVLETIREMRLAVKENDRRISEIESTIGKYVFAAVGIGATVGMALPYLLKYVFHLAL